MVPIKTHSGIYLGHMPSIPLEEKCITRIFSLIVRGLNFKIRREFLPADTTFDFKRVTGPSSVADIELLRTVDWSGTGTIGDGVFECG